MRKRAHDTHPVADANRHTLNPHQFLAHLLTSPYDSLNKIIPRARRLLWTITSEAPPETSRLGICSRRHLLIMVSCSLQYFESFRCFACNTAFPCPRSAVFLAAQNGWRGLTRDPERRDSPQ